MNGSNVEIRQVDGSTTREVFLNGHKLNGVRRFCIEGGVNQIPTLHLDLNVINCTVDGEVVMFDDLTKQGIKEIVFE